MCFKKTISITAIGIALFLATTALSQAACQEEGLLHRLVRTVFQVPVAVLKSLEGPTCEPADGNDYSARVRYPDVRSVYGPAYRLNSQEEYEPLPDPPRYVTYKMIPAQKSAQKTDSKANLHVYSSIPFSEN